MRVWDLDPKLLCNQHLLAEHRDIHAIWKQLVTHPEFLTGLDPAIYRWAGREAALYIRHGWILEEMLRRKFKHNSRLTGNLKDLGSMDPPEPLLSIEGQKAKLVRKCKACRERIGIERNLDNLFGCLIIEEKRT